MTNKEKLLKQAIVLNEDKKYLEVDDLLTNELLEKYNDVALYAEKAMALWNLRKYEECEKITNIGYQLEPNNAKINNYLGHIYSDKEEYKIAESHYIKAIEKDLNYSNAYNGLGIIYRYKKEYEKAAENFKIAIEKESKSPKNANPYYNLAQMFFWDTKQYQAAKELYIQYIEIKNDTTDYYSDIAKSRIEEIDNLLESKQYEKITNTVLKIKELLLFKKGSITHYTGISIAKFLIIDETQFRLSEGAFLNDTSEGTILFDYLDFDASTHNNCGPNATVFSKKPFIGSFVNQTKNNDLTLWRMYGKENLEEAKGCAITIDIDELKESIKQKLRTNNDALKDFEELEFYKVAYLENNKFTFSESKPAQVTKLNSLMKELQSEVIEFKEKPDKKPHETLKIVELLNEVAYLFKNAEYQYENEVRLVIKDAIGFEKKIDTTFTPPKVYVELISILPMIKQITIGPKVERADEWAAAFHYQFLKKDLRPEISISNLPFK